MVQAAPPPSHRAGWPGKTFDLDAHRLGRLGVIVCIARPGVPHLGSLLISTGLVALAEIGDKTQLLAFFLAARFKRPWPIIWGILVATLANHAGAGALGSWLTSLATPGILRWTLGLSFLAMAAWMLIPDRLDHDETAASIARGQGVFWTTVITFFLAEMGDKTQVATVALAAQYHALVPVVAGTTLGMMLANVPAVILGDRVAARIPVRLVHGIAAAIFAALGLATLLGLGARWGL